MLSPQATYQRLQQRKIRLFEELFRFTFNQCGFCVQSGCACKDRICQHVQEQARSKGIHLEPAARDGRTPRFIGPNGCVVAPHLRETCTIYLCEKAQTKPGFDSKRYAKLKRLVDRIQWRLMELEDQLDLSGTSSSPR